MSDINAFIDDKVKGNDVFLFMKGTPDFPMCGFSGRVVQILGYLGVDYDSANVLENQELREGIKAYTRFQLEPTAAGSRITITDDYSRLPDAERAQRLNQVDKSLDAWGWALHEYLRHQQRWGRIAPWRWYLRRWWLPMTPRARRITYMLVLITTAELALVVLVALIYWIEFAG